MLRIALVLPFRSYEHFEFQWIAILAQRFPPFARSNPSGDEGSHEQTHGQADASSDGPMPDIQLQLEQDLADLIDELDSSNQHAEDVAFHPTATVQSGPSLSIILLSAASAVAGFITALYISYRELAFTIQASAAVATLFSSIVLGLTGAVLSTITHSRAATSNIVFSCGLIVLSLIFFALCLLAGAVAALLILMLAG